MRSRLLVTTLASITTLTTVLATSARADQESQADEAAASASEPAKKDDKPRRTIELGGRVFVRNTLSHAAAGNPDEAAGWTNDLDLESARMGVDFEDRKRHLAIEVEVEVEGRSAKVRDAYIRWDMVPSLRLQAGKFKAPIGAVSLASRWSLPTPERGLLNDFEFFPVATTEADTLPVGGRDIGLMLVWRGRHVPLRPEVSLAVFQGRVHDQLAGANQLPLGIADGFTEDAYARLEVRPMRGVHVGLAAGLLTRLEVAGQRDSFAHGFVASADTVAELGPVRLWLEGFLGDNPIHLDIIQNTAAGRFMAGRAIASVRARLPRGPVAYLEPFASAQYLDISDQLDDDTAMQLGAGAVVGFTKSLRVQLGYDRDIVDNRLAGQGSRFIVQAGAVF